MKQNDVWKKIVVVIGVVCIVAVVIAFGMVVERFRADWDSQSALWNEAHPHVEVSEFQQEAAEVLPEDLGILDDTEPEEAAEGIDQETLDLYLSYEPECIYVAADGMEYRMVGIDRALGSSFYILLGTYDQGETCAFLNMDPYNGSGGNAMWLDFVDETVGFSCLSHSGGSYGSLYRTGDGGMTFSLIEYPSANIRLSDGTYYNPFVMPERVYKEDGKLYMLAGQGPDGDHYGPNGERHGLYASEDLGESWNYVGEVE